MLRRYVTEDGRLLRAIDRAHALRHYARKVSDSLYRVYSESEPGQQYEIRVTPYGLKCNCKAGYYGKPCKHAARVALRLARNGGK